MLTKPHIIQGGRHTDNRGTVSFVNDFRFEGVKRFYIITHTSASIIRAWRGHKYETKYFYCLEGKFLINLVRIDRWEQPSPELPVETYQLGEEDSRILVVPPGYVNGLMALSVPARLLVFSDKTLEESAADDHRFTRENWFTWKTTG